MSELHLQILRERLKRRDKVEVETREPKIPYRETIQANAEGMYRHKKQTGGRGQFGEVHIRMFPLPKDVNVEEWATKARFPSMKETHYDEENNFLWIDSVVGGTIPGNFLPAIEKGFRERIERGVIAGYKVQNVCVEVHFGKHHPVDSSEQAFKTAGSMAFRNVFQQAKPSLLEPIVRIEVTVPTANVGDINSDMSGRRGRVLSMDSAGGDLANGDRRSAVGRSDHLRPQPIEHHRRPRQLHDRVEPLRHRPRQRPARDHRQGADEGRGRGVATTERRQEKGSRRALGWVKAGLARLEGGSCVFSLTYCSFWVSS